MKKKRNETSLRGRMGDVQFGFLRELVSQEIDGGEGLPPSGISTVILRPVLRQFNCLCNIACLHVFSPRDLFLCGRE